MAAAACAVLPPRGPRAMVSAAASHHPCSTRRFRIRENCSAAAASTPEGRACRISLAASQDAMYIKKRGFELRWMTRRAMGLQ